MLTVWNSPVAFFGAIALGILASTALVILFLWKRTKLNWYEQNLIEIAKSEPQLISYKKQCTKNAPDSEDSSSVSDVECGKKKRWFSVKSAEKLKKKFQHQDGKATSMDTEYPRCGKLRQNSADCISLPSLQNIGLGPVKHEAVQPDVSEKFFVPQTRKLHQKPACSMFQGLDMNKIDKGLYESNRLNCLPFDTPVLGPCGSIQMALFYDHTLSTLGVNFLRAADLRARKNGANPNPYFRLLVTHSGDPLVPKQTFQTTIHQNKRLLTMDERFLFDVAKYNVNDYNLQISVYDNDEQSIDECIGCCWLGLSHVEIRDKEKIEFWLEIMPPETENENAKGELLLSISYLSKAQRLIVLIMKARNLVVPDDLNEPPDPCVKITAICHDKKKQKKTGVRKATYDPVFNESLAFNIPKNSLSDVKLQICIFHEPHPLKHNKLIGRLDLHLQQCKDLWRCLIQGDQSSLKWYQIELQRKST